MSRRHFKCGNTERIKKSDLHYTRDTTPKRVASDGIHLRSLAPGHHCSEETSQLVFPPGKSGREFWGFEISRLPANLCQDPAKFFYISKEFSGTDIHHFDVKNALLQI